MAVEWHSSLHLVENGPSDASQIVTVLDHGRPVATPPSSLSETVLAGKDFLLQLMYLPLEVVEPSQLGINVHLFVIVAVRLVLRDRVDPGHGDIALDIGYPDRGNLLEAHSESNVMDRAAVNEVDVEAEQLLLRYVVPGNTGEVPGGIDETVVFDD